MPNTKPVSVDTTSIPDHVRHYLLAPIADAAADYIAQPGVKAKYDAWLAERKAADTAQSKA